MDRQARASVLVIACGALARELKLLKRQRGLGHVALHCLPAELHHRPARIPGAVRETLEWATQEYDEVFVAYADCGTAGALDAVLDEFGVCRLPGAHCYELFVGRERFEQLQEEELGTFYLTDFLVRHFDSLVIRGLGLDRHPELADQYFGNYRRVVYLQQVPSNELVPKARECARRLGLDFEIEPTGLAPLADALARGSDPANTSEAPTWRS
jgi:hypothetical protein